MITYSNVFVRALLGSGSLLRTGIKVSNSAIKGSSGI